MLNLVSWATPSMIPAATAPIHDGPFMYLQNRNVAATPIEADPMSVVISRQCARTLGQKSQRHRLRSPPPVPYSRDDQANTASPPTTEKRGMTIRASRKSSK